MRYVWSALGCLGLLVALSAVNMGIMTARLAGIDAALAEAYESCGEEALERARMLWKENDAYLCATVPHESMDGVTEAMTRAGVFLREKRFADARAEIEAAREGVRALVRTERLDPGNIL